MHLSKKSLHALLCLSLLVACTEDTRPSSGDRDVDRDSGTRTSDASVGGDGGKSFPVQDATVVHDGSLGGSMDASRADAASTEPEWTQLPDLSDLQVTVLDDVTTQDGKRFQLLRLQYPGRLATYAQFYPPTSGTRRPVVVVTKPYDGIAFTGEEVDQRWAALGTGYHPDVDGPAAGPMPGAISYTLVDPASVDDGALFRLHDMGALMIYGRYYAGGDVDNDIDDMVTGLDYLATSELVDLDRIGIWGGSWGGFEALYAAAYARSRVRPRVGGALSPLSDFAREVRFVTEELPALYSQTTSRDAAAAFFDPYLRRIEPTRARRGGYSGLTALDLVARSDTPFLLIHDDWDTLVSFDQSETLHRLAPNLFSALWLLHTAPPLSWDSHVNGHGPLLSQFQNACLTFLLTYLLNALADDDQAITTLWDLGTMRALSLHMLALQRAGVDVDFYAERLRDLAQPRITARTWDNTASFPGPDLVAAEVNAVWGSQFTAGSVLSGLASGLPPPP